MMHQGLCDVSLIFLGFPLTVMHRLKVSFHSLPVKSLLCFPCITPTRVCLLHESARVQTTIPVTTISFHFPQDFIFFSKVYFLKFSSAMARQGHKRVWACNQPPYETSFISQYFPQAQKGFSWGLFFISTHHDVLFARAPKNAQATIPILETKTRHFPEGKKGFSMFMFSLCYGYGPIDKQRTW